MTICRWCRKTTIYFLYGRREALQGKSEAFKKSVREYLESSGFSQTTDSSIQGTFADMIFVNPITDPGKKFLIESKAEVVSLKSKKLARELIKYFQLSKTTVLLGMSFKLFAQGVNKPTEWESIFSEKNDFEAVKKWCEWYNDKCLEEGEKPLTEMKMQEIYDFFGKSEVIVGPAVDLQHAAIDNQSISDLSISKMATGLCNLVDRRRSPVPKKSKIVMNILPISVPTEYYLYKSVVSDKKEIYDKTKGQTIAPFLFTRDKEILTFADFDKENKLFEYTNGSPTSLRNERASRKKRLLISRISQHSLEKNVLE